MDTRLLIRYVDPSTLRESPRNARTHSAAEIEQLAALIKQFGFTNPILVGEKQEIIAGHRRRRAAIALKMKLVPIIPLGGLTAKQQRALRLADNRVAMNGGWDEALLERELRELGKDVDLEELGFKDGELRRILKRADKTDDAPKYEETFAIIIECTGEKQQVKLLERFGKEGLKCRALVS